MRIVDKSAVTALSSGWGDSCLTRVSTHYADYLSSCRGSTLPPKGQRSKMGSILGYERGSRGVRRPDGSQLLDVQPTPSSHRMTNPARSNTATASRPDTRGRPVVKRRPRPPRRALEFRSSTGDPLSLDLRGTREFLGQSAVVSRRSGSSHPRAGLRDREEWLRGCW